MEKPMTQSDANKVVGRIIAEEAIRYGTGVGMNPSQISVYGNIIRDSVYASLYHQKRTGVLEPVLVFEGKGYVPRDKRDLYDKEVMELPETYGMGVFPLPSSGGGFFSSIGSVLSGIGSALGSIVNVIPKELLTPLIGVGAGMLAQKYLGPKPPDIRQPEPQAQAQPQPVYAPSPTLPPGYTVGPGGQAIPPGYTVGAGGQIVAVASESPFSNPMVIITAAISGVLLLTLLMRR